MSCHSYTPLKNIGGLVKPNNDIFCVVKNIDQVINHMLNSCDLFTEQNIVEKVMSKNNLDRKKAEYSQNTTKS